ncbi:MAG: Uma2 family endonuclease [Sulfuricellaceae bacterium]
MIQVKLKPLSEADYLAQEAESSVRHELVGGSAYAIASASVKHNRIALNLATRLNIATQNSQCQVFISNVKLRADSFPTYYYPDIMLVCDPSDDDPLVKTRPCLLLQDAPLVEIYRRRGLNEWLLETLEGNDMLRLECLPLEIPLADLYRGVMD